MLGTFQKTLSQAATSQGYFSKGIFISSNFPNVQFPKSVLAAALIPLACSSRSARPPLEPVAPKKAFGKLHIWKVDTWEVALVKMPLWKYLTPFNIK